MMEVRKEYEAAQNAGNSNSSKGATYEKHLR